VPALLHTLGLPQVKIKAHLRDSLTGDFRIVETGPYKEAHTAIYHWTEGNYECDCNRSRFLWDWDEENT
jgi:hypothetical protein